eukprot:CAMPEP_0185580962 /NCGR_PEP_ID=MMETSP0434-20130131/18016_1 /TAXON_ID=626734 ORGANISM="Favella taraikaensis, Strain Fe Narragansett Bay" /NCGR_SAMPLE_ID=MMETSP0434 /ASSEMBLY_ACC=CAM_ASM_000379 /LENGTH=76 /DNA_ID=CAMNT_0028199383 /DNA_START=611 /DNA_END=841 /DNA_ORIENTATION=+
MSNLLLMPLEQTDFFIRLYEIVEANRLMAQSEIEDHHLKERFEMVNTRAKFVMPERGDKGGFRGFPVMAYLRKMDQ